MVEKTKKPRVVILDDNPQILSLLNRFLSRKNLEVISFLEPQKAMDYLKETGADLLIVDSRMPQMTGPEVIRALKKDIPLLPIILMSSLLDVDIKEEMAKLGVSVYLTKPFELNYLERVVLREVLDRESLH